MTSDEIRKCEKSVLAALAENPLVKVMLLALRDANCEVIPNRHLVCEPCGPSVVGGFDKEVNQVLICSNNCTTSDHVGTILLHELIHMYDFCSSKINFDNVDHLACTEIRAANLSQCGLGDRAFGKFHLRHSSCVKTRAAHSVKVIKGMPLDEATKHVERNFDKCYHDLEPIGRRYTNFEGGRLAHLDFMHYRRNKFHNQKS